MNQSNKIFSLEVFGSPSTKIILNRFSFSSQNNHSSFFSFNASFLFLSFFHHFYSFFFLADNIDESSSAFIGSKSLSHIVTINFVFRDSIFNDAW